MQVTTGMHDYTPLVSFHRLNMVRLNTVPSTDKAWWYSKFGRSLKYPEGHIRHEILTVI